MNANSVTKYVEDNIQGLSFKIGRRGFNLEFKPCLNEVLKNAVKVESQYKINFLDLVYKQLLL